jgi:hypothetical protein
MVLTYAGTLVCFYERSRAPPCLRATYTPRTRRSSSVPPHEIRPQDISRSHQGDDVAQREIEARITLQEATERANIGQHGGAEPVLGKAPASTMWTTGHRKCALKRTFTTLSRTPYSTTSAQTTCHLHMTVRRLWRNILSLYVYCYFLLPILTPRRLSLNWPPRFNRARPPQLLVTTHYSCHCASRHLLAGC